jgi:hypothetical protein
LCTLLDSSHLIRVDKLVQLLRTILLLQSSTFQISEELV